MNLTSQSWSGLLRRKTIKTCATTFLARESRNRARSATCQRVQEQFGEICDTVKLPTRGRCDKPLFSHLTCAGWLSLQ